MKTFGRRAIVQGLGIGAASLGSLRGRRAEAATVPKRLIIFFGQPQINDQWRPVGIGGAPPTETAWDLGPSHKPLAPWKNHLIYMDGIGMVSEEVDKGPKGNAHAQGSKHALSAAETTKSDMPGGISIDQYVAEKINSPSPVTKFRSLHVGIAEWYGGYNNASASGPNLPLRTEWDPRKTHARVFGAFVGGPNGNTADALREQQLAVLGFAKDDIGRLRSRLGGDARTRLETHAELLTDLDKRLRLAPSLSTCTAPTLPTDFVRCDLSCYNSTREQRLRNYQLSRDLNLRLGVAALACDLTRVLYVDHQDTPNELFGFTNGMFGATDSHDLDHKVNDRNNPVSRDPGAIAAGVKRTANDAAVLASLLAALEGVPQADGKTLLDHTLVLWCAHVGYGSHSLTNLPWVLVGRANGYFRTGRYLKYTNPKSKRGIPHNDLFVSMANAMGIETNTFGNPAVCTGALAGLR